MKKGHKVEETVRKTFLPFCLPSIGEAEKKEVLDTLGSGWITTGPKTKKFEENFRNYIGSQHAIAVSSCTAALHLALAALDIGPGDEVITSPFTFAATANVVEHCGARPVFVDIERETYNIDPDLIEAKITPATRAIMVVHYAGHPCEMEKIRHIATGHHLHIIEDAAHALGSEYRGKKAGTLGDVGCFSFYPTKSITTGEGGMVTCQDSALAEKIRIMSLHGISKDAWKRYSANGSWFYEVTYAGFKYNMTDIQASLGIHQLDRLEDFITARQCLASLYDEAFSGREELTLPVARKGIRHAKHLYTVLLNLGKLSVDRAEFIQKLQEENIGTSVHFIPLHLHPYYRQRYGYRKGDFPVAEDVYERIVSLPLYPMLTEEDVEYVIRAVFKIINTHHR
ncbi:MAG TPA: DegT/DnrJ/EryC1/StrS family aminotransferase [Candidatus Hypogeohydataceae bacterium YC38]